MNAFAVDGDRKKIWRNGLVPKAAVCAYLAALAAALAGCSESEVVQNFAPATAIDLPQPNYRDFVKRSKRHDAKQMCMF